MNLKVILYFNINTLWYVYPYYSVTLTITTISSLRSNIIRYALGGSDFVKVSTRAKHVLFYQSS